MARARLSLSWLVVFVVLAWGRPAAAWIELSVRSDNVTIDVARDGSAVVAHELLLYLRGGPLKEIAIDGVDADAEPMPDATITRTQSGRMAGLPIPLTVEASEGQLRGTIQLTAGLRSGTYLVRVRYRTDLKGSGRIVPDGVWTLVRWQSPRHATGVDSMRVLFRMPRADDEPRLPGGTPGESTVIQEGEGVFLATVRRGDQTDEIEIVRPHVARAEEVTWRTLVDPDAFEPGRARAAATDRGEAQTPADVRIAPVRPRDPRPWAAGALAGCLYGVLVALKGRAVNRVCALRRATSRSLLPMPLAARSMLAGVTLGVAVTVAWLTALPTLAALLVAAAMAFAASLPPVARVPLRGPGTWERVTVPVAFDDARPRLPWSSRVFDAGQPIGFIVFLVALIAWVAGALLVLRLSAYHGIAILLSASVLFPLFCMGRAGELPPEPLARARARLEPLHTRLHKRGLRVVPLMRVPAAGGEADELRLLVELDRPIKGLEAIEIGVDHHRAAGSTLSLPFVIVRVLEGSAAIGALPVGLLWTRGRSPEERVAVLRPRLPMPRLTLKLVLDVVRALTAPARATRAGSQSVSKADKSGGKGASTAKPAVRSSPAHAT